jgi:hypothetical protein
VTAVHDRLSAVEAALAPAFSSPRSETVAETEIHDTGARDDGDPTDTQSAKEIARLLKEHGGTDLFGGGGAAYGANTTHRAKTIGQRRLEQARASTRPENLIER